MSDQVRTNPQPMLRPLAIVLLPIGVFSTAVGLVDALSATLIEYRLIGVLLFAVGGILIAGSAGLFVGGARGRALALVASAAAPLVGLNLLLAQLGARVYDARLGLWLLILVAPAWAIVALWQSGVRTTLPRQVVGVISAGLLVSVIQFWYTAQYVPSSIAPSLTITLDLSKVGENHDQTAVAATVTVKNASATRVRVLGSMYRISGIRKCFTREISDARGFATELAKAWADDRSASRIAQDRVVDVLAADKFVLLPEGGWFDPGQEATRRFMVWVPREQYDLTRLETFFFFGKGSQLELDVYHGRFGPRTGVQRGFNYIEQGWRLKDPSLLAKLTTGELNVGGLVLGSARNLVTRWYVGGTDVAAAYPYMTVYMDQERWPSTNPPFDDYNVEMEAFYGLAVAPSSTELALWPATSPFVLLASSQAAGTAVAQSPIGRGGGCP